MAVDTTFLLKLSEGAQSLRRPFDACLCVLDTNVVLDLLLFNDPKIQSLKKAIKENSLKPIGHYDTFYEFADVIAREQFHLNEAQINQLLNAWLELHYWTDEPLPLELYCKDADDDKFFNLAQLCSARYLFSKDKKVLKARGKVKRFGCMVLKPENFVA